MQARSIKPLPPHSETAPIPTHPIQGKSPFETISLLLTERKFEEASRLFASLEDKGPWTKTIYIKDPRGGFYAPPLENKIKINIMSIICEEALKAESLTYSEVEQAHFCNLVLSVTTEIRGKSFLPTSIAGIEQVPLNALLDALLRGNKNPLLEKIIILMLQNGAVIPHYYIDLIKNSKLLKKNL